ncbi:MULTISPECIES: AlpA family transcriptional regulator [Rhodomicrobium]|uniref:helix-turn-helix transcriptional regulator n=1 Tax=Rhodomicrobium TaxID=1068 RepID=UPI000B4BFD23|nr:MULTISPECIES: AlpA family transcriptional regulator [Rhodomicrobium]
MADAPLRKFLRLPAVEAAIGKKKSWLYRAVEAGEFPRPIKIGSATVVWDAAEIGAWQAQRIAERDQAAADA